MTLMISEVMAAVPANLKSSVTQSLVDKINAISADPMVAENIRENFISYTSVLKDGKFKTEDYLSAVVYVSFKLMGDTNQDAWCKTFPLRYTALLSRGAMSKEISAHVSAYNKGKLVNAILEQSLVPTWVLNADLYQKAINVQADLMTTAFSEKVRSDAANSLLTHLKKPEGKDFQISIDTKDNSGMNEMRQALLDMAAQQRQLLASGAGIKNITNATIINAEAKVTSV